MSDLDRMEETVHDGDLRAVDQLARPLGQGRYRITGAGGTVTYAWSAADGPVDVTVDGDDPVGRQDPGYLASAAEQRADPHPDPDANAFPYAFENVAQLFDGLHAPDAVVLAHPGQRLDGVVGHHGGLGVVQARAPFVAAGPGIAPRGMVDEHLRMIDVAPTLVALAGGAPLAVQDGQVRDELVTEPVDHVVVFLLDGTNAAALWEAVESGEAPTIAGLGAAGTAYRHGVLASLPTATLANHTTALTGVSPGHSGVLHHTWYDRRRGTTPDLLSIPAMFGTREHLGPGVETVHEAIKRGRPDAFTACTNEFVDRGADWSTFACFDRGERLDWASPDAVASTSASELMADESCAFMSAVDTTSVDQARALFAPGDHPVPTFCWVALNITDVAGHAAGPHSTLARAAISDSDRRVARVLDAVDAAGVRDRTAVVVMADHGMQQSADAPQASIDEYLPSDRWLLVDHALAYEKR